MIKAEVERVNNMYNVHFTCEGTARDIAYELTAILAVGLMRLEPNVKTSMRRFSRDIAKSAYKAYKEQIRRADNG